MASSGRLLLKGLVYLRTILNFLSTIILNLKLGLALLILHVVLGQLSGNHSALVSIVRCFLIPFVLFIVIVLTVGG